MSEYSRFSRKNDMSFFSNKQTMKKTLYILLLFLCNLLTVKAQSIKEEWQLSTDTFHNYHGITLGNGRIGLVCKPAINTINEIVLNGVYDKEYSGGVSRIVRAPLFTTITIRTNGLNIDSLSTNKWEQDFDMKHATLTTSAEYEQVKIRSTFRALRQLPYMTLGIFEIYPQKDIELEVSNTTSFPEELKDTNCHFKLMRDGETLLPVRVSQANSRTGIQKIATCTSFLFDEPEKLPDDLKEKTPKGMTFKKTLRAGTKYRFALIGSVCTSRDFSDPKNESERMVVYALQQNINQLAEEHDRAWENLWESDIEIEGCPEDQKDVRLALYNLYASQRENSRLSIPPMGLSTTTGYNGHIFWDSELWMYPPILLLNQGLAKAHIDYRTDRLAQAMKRADQYGFEGAMYPWESDDSGEEATPTWCLTGPLEHHISADVSIAFWNYYRVTRDIQWLQQEGYQVIKEVADFWISRASQNTDGTFSICNVVGANEYAQHVNDNAFTNGAAKTALENAQKAAKTLGYTPNPKWEKVANGLCFHHMKDGTTKEHANYNGEIIKQADVNLLAYPLEVVQNPIQIEKDLKYYENKIDKQNGPAMGNSILSILYCRLGNSQKAYELFHKSFQPNKRPPYGVLAESATSDNPYFVTGAGGMLQAVLFGFAGLELTDEGVVQKDPILPKAWKSLTIKGVGPEKKSYTIHR